MANLHICKHVPNVEVDQKDDDGYVDELHDRDLLELSKCFVILSMMLLSLWDQLKNKADDNIYSNDNRRSPNDQSLLSCVDFEPVNTQVLCSLLDICEIHILNILQAV